MATMQQPVRAELELQLRYSGPEVDDGTMSLDDLVPVLQGFGGAYGKIAGFKGISAQHKLRLVSIKPGSASLILDVWEMIGKNSQNLQAVGAVVSAAMVVMTTIVGIIKVKKHVKKKPYSTKLEGLSNSITIVNSDHVSISVPLDVFTAFKDGQIDADLAKVIKPLEQGRVDSGTIQAKTPTDFASETIDASERNYFEIDEPIAATTTQPTWLIGQINAMTKSTNSGYVYLTDGTRVFFKLVGDNPGLYYGLFAHAGLVRMRCIAQLDENLRPIELSVFEMHPIQPDLPFEGSEATA